VNKILELKFGSALYGTSTPNSDIDLKGIYLPTARQIVLGTYRETITKGRSKAEGERNTKDDTDIEIFSLDRFLKLLTEGQTVALDFLFAPLDMYTENCTTTGFHILKEIQDNKEKLLTRNVCAFIGYARMQAARYGIKGSRMDALRRTSEYLDSCDDHRQKLSHYAAHFANLVDETNDLISLEKTPLVEIAMLKGPKGLVDQPHLRVNGRSIPFHATVKYAREIVGKMLEGYGQRAHKANLAGNKDYKAISHAIRINKEGLELLTTGHITFPCPERELLLKVKLGELPFDQVAEMIEQGLADLYIAHEKSTLRDKPDQEWVDNFVYDVYSRIVKNGDSNA